VDLPRLLEGAGEGDGLGAAALATEAAGRLERAANRAAGTLLQRLEPGLDQASGGTAQLDAEELAQPAGAAHARSVAHGSRLPGVAAAGAARPAAAGDDAALKHLGHVVAARISDAAATLEQWAGFAGSAMSDWLGINRYPEV
jgi:hypothetical protein